MKEMYSIGEIAAICGISVQTLRYYTKLGLLQPCYVNEETGYRYYSTMNIPLVDRIKYLKKFGLSLAEIREILQDGTPEALLPYLRRQKTEALRELERVRNLVDEIDWYIDYFVSVEETAFLSIPFQKTCPERYVFSVPVLPGEAPGATNIRLLNARNRPEFADTEYHFQYTFSLDFADLLDREFRPKTSGLFLAGGFPQESEYVSRLPAGAYFCFRGRLRVDDWDPRHCIAYFAGKTPPAIVIANEHESHFIDYEDSVFEVQIYIGETLS